MPIEHKSSPDSQQEAWLTQASSTDIQHAQESEDTGNKLRKINNILWPFEFTDGQEDKYTKSLQQLNQDQLAIVKKLDRTAFEDLLNKPQAEVLQYLIQAQIDEINAQTDLSKDDKRLRYNLRKELIAVEKSETEKNTNLIATEKSETTNIENTILAQENSKDSLDFLKQEQASIRGALQTLNIGINQKYSSIQQEFDRYDSVMSHYEKLLLENKQAPKLKNILSGINQRVLELIKAPWTLETIAMDLGWKDSKAFKSFESKMLSIDPSPSMRRAFDRVKADFAWELAKAKLWTDNLDWVNLDDDVLIKTQWDLTIEAWKNDRNVSLEWSNYKLPSTLDSKYEDQIEWLHQQSKKELAPFNKELTTFSDVLNIIKRAQEKGVRFEDTKTHIQQKYPETYNTLGLSSKQSYNECMNAIHAHSSQLENSKKKIIKKTTKKLEQITAQNKKEAQEKDRTRIEMLRFLNSTWVDEIDQDKLTPIIDMVNLNHFSYGLQQPIDFANWSLGFNLDNWNKTISLLEKKAFIGFINKMLWENVISEDIAGGITTIQPDAISKLRDLNNNITGFFMTNLNKQDV